MDERLKRVLIRQNPHWQNIPLRTYEFKRDLYTIVKRDLVHPQIIAITGLRRVGKTVLVKQLMEHVIGGVPDLNIGYISFDDRDFQRYDTAYELIEYFLTFSDRNIRRYLFLDEVQKIPDWPDLLKSVYDTETDLKMVITGSSSLDLKDNRETLAGRSLTHHLPVLTFKEFVRFFGHEVHIDQGSLIRSYDIELAQKKELFISLFEDYLGRGAFPELLEHGDDDFSARYIKESILDKAVFDISRKVRPRREDIVGDLLVIFARNTARAFDISNIASTLGINRNYTSEVISALKDSFIIKVDHNYSKSAHKQARTGKKAYIAHSSLMLAALNYPLKISDIGPGDVGLLVETVIANALSGTNFWRTPQKDEVDVIIPGPVPIEVKYRENVLEGDIKGLKRFMERFKGKIGIVVTKDRLDIIDLDVGRVFLIPAWLFLLLEQDGLKDLG